MRKLVEIYFKGRDAPIVVDFEGEWPAWGTDVETVIKTLSEEGRDRRLKILDWETVLAIVEVPVVTDGQEVWTSPEGEEFSGPRETV